MINDKKLVNINNLESIESRSLEKGQTVQPIYSDIANINIRKFLKLKQHTYDVEEKAPF